MALVGGISFITLFIESTNRKVAAKKALVAAEQSKKAK